MTNAMATAALVANHVAPENVHQLIEPDRNDAPPDLTQALYTTGSPPTGPWSDRAIYSLITLAYAKTHTAGQLATEINAMWPECHKVSRGAVLGKANRLGISLEAGLKAGHIANKAAAGNSEPKLRANLRKRQQISAAGGLPQGRRIKSPLLRQAIRASSSPENAPGRLPESQRGNLRQAATLLNTYHHSIITTGTTAAPTTISAEDLEELISFWPNIAPRLDYQESKRACQYPTGQHPENHRWYYCGCTALPGKPYCDSHQKLCRM